MQDLIQTFLDYGKDEKNYSSFTLKGYRCDLLNFVRWLASEHVTEPGQLTRSHIQRYDTRMSDNGLRPRSRRRKIAAIRAFTLWLTDERETLAVNPARRVKLPQSDEAERRLPTDAEKAALFDGAQRMENPYLCALSTMMLALMFYAGLRPMEVTALDLAEIDLERRVLIVRKGKRSKRREMPVSDALAEHVRAWLPLRRQSAACGRLVTTRFGRPVTYHVLRTTMVKIKIAAGLREADDLTAYCLRHWFASSLHKAGVDLDTLRRLMGHDHLNTTQVYLHELTDNLRDAVNLLGRPAKPNPLKVVEDPVRRVRLIRRTG